jgi:hypothetical protein
MISAFGTAICGFILSAGSAGWAIFGGLIGAIAGYTLGWSEVVAALKDVFGLAGTASTVKAVAR